MDFTYSEEQEAVRELAGRIFTERVHPRAAQGRSRRRRATRARSTASCGRSWPRPGCSASTWPRTSAGPGSTSWPPAWSIEAAGRTAAYVPVVETMVYGARHLDRFGTDEQRQTWLARRRPAARPVLTAALAELVGDVVLPGGTEPGHHGHGAGRRVLGARGHQGLRAGGLVADAVLVPATCRTADGIAAGAGVFIVEPRRPGLTLTRQTTTTGRPEAIIELAGVRRRRPTGSWASGADGAAVVDCITELATTALCVQEAGVCARRPRADGRVHQDAGAVREADRHLPGRGPAGRRRLCRHRGHPAHGLAGGLAAGGGPAGRRPRWRWPSTGRPRAASVWSTPPRTCTAASGVDRDYPLHRFFLLTEQIELTLGRGQREPAPAGRILAAEPV